jgi:hypothetical protein
MDDLPRFPVPFLDGLLEYLPLRDVLALTSVDRREAPGRKHAIVSAAAIGYKEQRTVGEHTEMLERYPTCGLRKVYTCGNSLCYESRLPSFQPLWTRITELTIWPKHSVELSILPPRLRILHLDCSAKLTPDCAVPDSLESLSTYHHVEAYGTLPNLLWLATPTNLLEGQCRWPDTVTRLVGRAHHRTTPRPTRLETVDSMTRLLSLTAWEMSGVERFPTTLQSLSLPYSTLSPRAIFPGGLTWLSMNRLTLDFELALPPGLRELHVEQLGPVESLGATVIPATLHLELSPRHPLPEGITTLCVDGDGYIAVGSLPESLRRLEVSGRPMHCSSDQREKIMLEEHFLAAIPSGLTSLTIGNCSVHVSSTLRGGWPTTLRYLSISVRDHAFSVDSLPQVDLRIVNGVRQ